MGRDTGIVLVTRRKMRLEQDEWDCTQYIGDEVVPNWARIEEETWREDNGNPNTYIEIAYWRKFHSIADEIDQLLGYDLREAEEKELSIAQLQKIQDILVEQLKNPDECQHGFLEMDEAAPMLAQQIMNISWLLKYLREAHDPHAFVFFYDSI